MAVSALLTGCGDPAPPAGPTLPDTWLQAMIEEPTRFEQLLEQTPREGWIALHRNDAEDAWAAFEGPDPTVRRARARAAWEMARLHENLARIHESAEFAYLSERRERNPDEPQSIPIELARDCAQLGAGTEALGPRRALHLAARESGDPTELLARAQEPVQTGEGPVPVAWFDPCLHTTLAQIWDARALRDLDATQWSEAGAWADGGLESTLFAAWLDRIDLRKAMERGASPGSFAAQSPATRALGLPDRVPGDTRAARGEARTLDDALDAWRQRLDAEAPEAGMTLERDLGLIRRFRQEWLLARGTLALEDGHPAEALVFLDHARDVADRNVGPANSARLFALLAAARFESGRDREALDALHPLSEAHPEVLGLRERLGDLSVLRALTRTGDSKEN